MEEQKLSEERLREYQTFLEQKHEYRRSVKRLCSVLGFSLLALFLGIQLIGILLYLLSSFLSSHKMMGMGAELFRVLNSDWFSMAGQSLLAYAIMLPIVEKILRRVPETKMEPRRMRKGKLFSFAVLVMGGGYIFNLAGSLINIVLAQLTGRPAENLMPINDVLQHMNWAVAVYVGIIAPIIEEYIFRGLILNRLRPLGEKAAVIFPAVMFGLMHGNLSQTMYATAIGIVFGYIAVKTGRIFYNTVLHILVNSYTIFIVVGVMKNSVVHGEVYNSKMMLISLFTIGCIIGAVIIFVQRVKKTRLKPGSWPEGLEYSDFSSAMFLNPGTMLFGAVCVGLIIFFAFFA